MSCYRIILCVRRQILRFSRMEKHQDQQIILPGRWFGQGGGDSSPLRAGEFNRRINMKRIVRIRMKRIVWIVLFFIAVDSRGADSTTVTTESMWGLNDKILVQGNTIRMYEKMTRRVISENDSLRMLLKRGKR